MKSLSLEAFYLKIKKHILLLQGYTEIEYLESLIKSCRLKPFNKATKDVSIHDKWVDEFGNSFNLVNGKKFKIIYNDLSISSKGIITDIYYGLDIVNVAKISKLAYICYGKDEEYNEMYFIAFMGIDNYLRCFLNLGGDWEKVSPLLLGTKHLQNIIKNSDIRFFKKFPNKEKTPFPCVSGEAWLTSLPVSTIFVKTVSKEHDVLLELLNSNKGI